MQWLSLLVVWIREWFAKPAEVRPRIMQEYSSLLCRLLLVDRRTDNAVRTWRAIPFYTREYDLLITCDRLTPAQKKDPVFRGSLLATHRVAVLQVGRIPTAAGTFPVRQLFLGDFDMEGAWATAGDRYASICVDLAAKRLLKKHDTEIDWLAVFRLLLRHYLGVNHRPD